MSIMDAIGGLLGRGGMDFLGGPFADHMQRQIMGGILQDATGPQGNVDLLQAGAGAIGQGYNDLGMGMLGLANRSEIAEMQQSGMDRRLDKTIAANKAAATAGGPFTVGNMLTMGKQFIDIAQPTQQVLSGMETNKNIIGFLQQEGFADVMDQQTAGQMAAAINDVVTSAGWAYNPTNTEKGAAQVEGILKNALGIDKDTTIYDYVRGGWTGNVGYAKSKALTGALMTLQAKMNTVVSDNLPFMQMIALPSTAPTYHNMLSRYQAVRKK